MPRRVLLACCCLTLLTRALVAAPETPPDPGTPSVNPKEQPAPSTLRRGAEAPNDVETPRRAESPRAGEPAPARPEDVAASTPSAETPKGVLKLLAAGLRDGDTDRIRQVMYASNASETRMVAAMADMAKAMAALQRSAVKAFGREGAKEVVGDTDATDTDSKARIDSAEVKVNGDTATVTMEDGEEAPVVLKRVDGRWRLPMAELSRGADLAALEERLAGLAEQSKLVRELADEVGAGKYASPAQAHEAWQSRAMQASMRRVPPQRGASKREPAKDRQVSQDPRRSKADEPRARQ
jgi:hypothetical protein